jgi:hypothetical protein
MKVIGTGVPIFTTDIEATLERYKALSEGPSIDRQIDWRFGKKRWRGDGSRGQRAP